MTPRDAQVRPASEEERRFAVAQAGFQGDERRARLGLNDDSALVRAAAFGALVRMQRATTADVAAAASDSAPAVRRTLCELASRLGKVPLDALLADPDPMVLEAAALAAGEIAEVTTVPALCEIASRHDDPLCRESAVAALGVIGDERGRAVILAALDDVAQIRRRAVIALAGFSGPDVEAAMRARLEDRDWQVRQAAEDLLEVNRG